MKKNILFVQNIWFPQQWAVDIFYYAKFLAEDPEYKVTVIVASVTEEIDFENVTIHEMWNISYYRFVSKAFFLIKNLQKEETIDYVYFFAQHPFSVLLQRLVKVFLQCKTIYDVVSGPIGHWITAIISKVTIRLWVYLSDKYVVIDEWIVDNLSLPITKEHLVVPMWFDWSKFFENSDESLHLWNKNEIVFTYIWSLDKKRNLSVFLKAFMKVAATEKHIKLYFIGAWNNERELIDLTWSELNRSIFFLWKKKHVEIPKYINNSDILVSYIPQVPYFEHQPPTKLVEYLACNKPVIATATLAQKKILKSHQILLHEDTFEDTFIKIHEMITIFPKLWKNNYHEIVEEYSWNTLTAKMNVLF